MHTMIHRLPVALLAVSLLAGISRAQDSKDEVELIATLQNPQATHYDKGLACKQLAVSGTEASIPALARLLDDPKLAHMARFGLEPMPSPQVDKVLIEALGRLKGRTLIGVVHSLGNRGKPSAIDALVALLEDQDREVALAAAHSIARIGTPRSAKILLSKLNAQFAPACLVCGGTLAGQGDKENAALLLRAVGESDEVASHVRLAALHQGIKCQVADDVELLTMAFQSDIEPLFNMGLRAARLPQASGALKATLSVLPAASTKHKAQLITLIGDLGDPAGLPALLNAAADSESSVRIAALSALGNIGTAAQVKLLVDAAADTNESIAAAALETLTELKGHEIDDAVLLLLNDSDRQAIAVRLIGQRRVTSAVPQLLKMIDGDDRQAVVAALGETIALEQLDVLGKRLATTDPAFREAIQQAFHAACYRMPDRDATSAQVARYLEGAHGATMAFLMDELRTIGGSAALSIVGDAAESTDSEKKDYATQALGKWLDTSAAPVLLKLAQREGDSKYGIRCQSGYIRLIRQFSMPEAQRVAMARQALKLATRAKEQKATLDALTRYPSLTTLNVVVEASADPELKTAAQAAGLAMAQKIRGNRQEVRAVLAQIGLKAQKIEIIKAEYGAGEDWKDVTETLQKRVRGLPLIVLGAGSYNASFGGDPIPGTPKVLKIQYRIGGKQATATFKENEPILLNGDK